MSPVKVDCGRQFRHPVVMALPIEGESAMPRRQNQQQSEP